MLTLHRLSKDYQCTGLDIREGLGGLESNSPFYLLYDSQSPSKESLLDPVKLQLNITVIATSSYGNIHSFWTPSYCAWFCRRVNFYSCRTCCISCVQQLYHSNCISYDICTQNGFLLTITHRCFANHADSLFCSISQFQ